MSDEEKIEQIPDEQGTALPNDLMTIKEYAESIGQSYENIRKKIAKIKKLDEFKDHIIVMSNPETSQPMTFIDKHIQDYLASRRRAERVIVMSDTEKISRLELELKETKADRDQQRAEKEAYMKQLLEIKNNPQSLDTSKYILIEDHQKKLEELEEKSTKLESENEDLKKAHEEDEKKQEQIQKELTEAETNLNKLNSEKMLLEAEKSKIEAEAEVLKMKQAQELEEALKLGFFARRKKLKELKARQEKSNE